MSTLEMLRQRRAEIVALARAHGADNVRVFGSVARESDDGDSDVDILVDLDTGRSLVDLGALLSDLQNLLGRQVDVVTAAGLRARIRERVLAEARPI